MSKFLLPVSHDLTIKLRGRHNSNLAQFEFLDHVDYVILLRQFNYYVIKQSPTNCTHTHTRVNSEHIFQLLFVVVIVFNFILFSEHEENTVNIFAHKEERKSEW